MDARIARRAVAVVLALGVAVLLARAAAGAGSGSPLAAFVEWLRGAGAVGVAVYGLAYVVAVVGMVPGAWLAAAGGFVYGPLLGAALAWPAATAGATTAFVLGRFVARERVARRFAGNARFAAIDAAIASGGLRVLVLLRFSPLPHGLLNYGLSLTRARTRDYAVGTAIGIAPVCVLFAYGGSLARTVAELTSGAVRARLGPWPVALTLVGVVATAVVVVTLTRAARAALRRTMAPDEPRAGV